MAIKRFAALCGVGFLLFTLVACSPAARQRAGSVARGAAAGAAGASAQQYSTKLMIFGGLDHKTYLGCLNCNEYATDSVFNSYGNSGSPYSTPASRLPIVRLVRLLRPPVLAIRLPLIHP